jgi:homoserine kinase
MHAEAESPCTVGNFGPGFDVMSLALARRGDKVWLGTAAADKVTVRGPGHERVPTEWARNSACASLDHLRRLTGRAEPLEVVIEKGMPPGSGLGSSASSNASAVRAFARLFGVALTPLQALEAAAAGEAVATGSAHTDDVAAALFGGLTLVGGEGPDVVVRLRPPPLHLVVARPEVDLPTREMRRLIPDALPKASVVRNLGNVARIVHACHAGDGAMLCRALEDGISRPYRAPRVPLFEEARKAALGQGALGFLLSGSGPATIAAMPADVDPRAVESAVRDVFLKGGLDAEVFTTQPLPEVKDPAIPLPAMR